MGDQVGEGGRHAGREGVYRRADEGDDVTDAGFRSVAKETVELLWRRGVAKEVVQSAESD